MTSRRWFRDLLCLLAALALPVPAAAEWRSLATDAFVLFYPSSEEARARQLLGELEAGKTRVEAITGYRFRRYPVVLEDLGTYGNGEADPLFRRVDLYPYGMDAWSDVGFSERWFRSLAVHELTHIGHLSGASGLPAVLRAVFGPLLAPGLLSTSWMAEGLAVYVESGSSPYEGRLNEGFFDALVELQARDGLLPSLARATFSRETYPFGNASYVYGGSFVGYLASRGGEQAVASYLRSFAATPLSYLSPVLPLVGADRLASRVWGEGLPRLWDEWRAAAAARAPPPATEQPAGSAGAAEITGVVVEEGAIYYARRDELKTGNQSYQTASRIVRILPGGREQTVVSTPAALTGGLVVRRGTLTYAVQELEGGHANVASDGWGLTSVLRARDLGTGRDRALARVPLRCFTVLSDGTVLYAVDATSPYGSALWELRPGERTPRRLRSLGLRVLEIAAEASDVVLCARTETANTDLYRIDSAALEGGEPDLLVSSPWSESTIDVKDGILTYSSNPDGRRGAWGMDLRTGERWRYSAGTYALWPVRDVEAGTLVYAGLTSSGPRLMSGSLDHREPVPAPIAAPAERAADPIPTSPPARSLGYWPNLLTLVPQVRVPLVLTDFRYFQACLWLAGQSALGDLSYDVRGLYDVGSRSASVQARLGVRLAAPLGLDLSYASAAGHAVSITATLTPYRSLQSGVSSIGVELTASLLGTFSRVEIEPALILGYRAPYLRGGARVWVPLARVELGSPANGVGVRGTSWGVAGIAGGELSWSVEAGWSAAGADTVVPPVRGHTGSPGGSPGALARLSYEHPILKARDGLWNPPIYVGDVVASVFLEGSATPQGVNAAAGLQASIELKVLAVGTGMPVSVGGWIGIDEGLGFIYGFTATAAVPLWGGGQTADAPAGGLRHLAGAK